MTMHHTVSIGLEPKSSYVDALTAFNFTAPGRPISVRNVSRADIGGHGDPFETPRPDLVVRHGSGLTNVRLVKIAGEPWFLASNVCRTRDLFNVGIASKFLDGGQSSRTG